MRKIRGLVQKVLDTMVELDNALTALVSNRPEDAHDALRRLDMNEKAADNLEVDLFEALSAGDLTPKDREDMMRLVRRVDHIADWVKVAGRNVEIVIESKIKIPADVWKAFKEMSKNAVDCCRALKKTIECFGKDAEGVLRNRETVERLEHVIDEQYIETKKILVTSVSDARAVIILNDLLVGIENATDYCKGAADMLFILVMAGR